MDLLQQRYPNLHFFLKFHSFSPCRQEELHSPNLEEELRSWESTLSLDGIEILYVYGLGLGAYFERLQGWLSSRRGRLLIFLEDDLAVIDAFMKSALAEAFLKSENVLLKYIEDKSRWTEVLEELAISYPTDRIQVSALRSYAQKKGYRYKKIQLALYRNSSAINALLSDVLYSHKLFENLYPNFLKLPHSFFGNRLAGKFQNIPAVICGAGPSLEKVVEELKTMENRALLIAGGSAIRALSHHQIRPHLCMALDPNPEEYERLEHATAFEVPFLYAPRLQKDVFNTCNGPFGYMKSDTGGLSEEWFEKQIDLEADTIGPELGREAFSVTTLALAFAYQLGCNPIVITGVDLAFTGMNRYASGILENVKVEKKALSQDVRATEKLLVRKDRHGKKVHTLVKWLMESECISQFSTAHPETTFINATDGGIGFPKIPYTPFEEVKKIHLGASYDLRGMIHAAIQENGFAPEIKEKLERASEQLRESLKRCLKMGEEMLLELSKQQTFKETGKMVILQIDFKEEAAYDCFLKPVEFAIERLFARYYPEEDRQRMALERERAKWDQLKSMMESFLNSLNIRSACF